MGTWGTGIFDDDFACDLRDEYEDLTSEGKTPEQAIDLILKVNGDELDEEEEEEEPVFLLALSSLLLDAGISSHPLYERTRAVLEAGKGLVMWEGTKAEDQAERKSVYEALLARLPE